MLKDEAIPSVKLGTPAASAVAVLNRANLGAVLIIDEACKVKGIVTDGDVRRAMVEDLDLSTVKVDEMMTVDPVTIQGDVQAVDALSIMQQHEITILPIVDEGSGLIGILHLHNLLGKGEFRFLV